MKNTLGSEKNFYLTLSLPHNQYSIINIVSRFPENNSDEIDLISIYESISQKLISIIPNCQFVYINKLIGISILLSPTEKVDDFVLQGNIQHINSHIASLVTILLKENNQLEKYNPITTVSCFSSLNKEIINYLIDNQVYQFHTLVYELALKFYDKEFILSKTPKEINECIKKEYNTTVHDNYTQEDIMGITLIRERGDGDSVIINSYDVSLLNTEYLSQFISNSTNDTVADTEFDVDAL